LRLVFAKLDRTPRWRERLPALAIPPLVVHGRRDRFFPVGNGEALVRKIPGARLLVLEQAATAIPDTAAGEVAAAMLALQAVIDQGPAGARSWPRPPMSAPIAQMWPLIGCCADPSVSQVSSP
jgi:hypothetical protein